jgi:hypothetical protein
MEKLPGHEEVKRRPRYIVADEINSRKDLSVK